MGGRLRYGLKVISVWAYAILCFLGNLCFGVSGEAAG